MTREQKLALIVGFSLILLVGVLISDHLSSARRATIAKVDPEPMPVSPMPISLAAAPGAEHAAISPSPIIEVPGAIPVAPPVFTAGTQPENRGSPVTEPFRPDSRIAAVTPATHDQDTTLLDEVTRLGGKIVKGADGMTSIVFPAAAGSVPDAQRGAWIQSPKPSPTITPVGPIENLKTHAVAGGESLYMIAAKYYGNGNMWRELAKFNSMDKSGAVRVGMKIKVPSREALLGRTIVTTPPTSVDPGIRLIKPAPAARESVKPAPTKPGKIELASYTIQRGDTLGDISMRKLGTSKRWQEILELNNLDDEDALTPGDVLKLPAKKS